MVDDRDTGPGEPKATPSLTVERTPAGYWTVQRGGLQVAFAMTREAAERERETLERLGRCSERRSRRPQPTPA
jgi:hypothetical protein